MREAATYARLRQRPGPLVCYLLTVRGSKEFPDSRKISLAREVGAAAAQEFTYSTDLHGVAPQGNRI